MKFIESIFPISVSTNTVRAQGMRATLKHNWVAFCELFVTDNDIMKFWKNWQF
jgi:hypothetical protein